MKKKLFAGKKIVAVAAGAGLLLGFAGYGTGVIPGITVKTVKAAENGDLQKLKILVPGTNSDGSGALSEVTFVADSEGYLKDELEKIGYEPEYVGFATAGVGVNEAFAANEGDVAIYGDFPAITYLSNNDDASIFAVSSSRVQVGILAKDDIKTVEDLKGKKIGTGIGTNGYKYLSDLLEKNGMSLDDVEIVNATAELPSLYAGGDIDAIAYVPTMLYKALESADGHILTTNEDDKDLASTFVAVGKNSLLDKHPEIVTAFKTAFTEGQEFAEKNPQKVYDAMAEKSQVFGADIYKSIYQFDESFSYWKPELTDEVIDTLQNTADYMKKNGYIKKDVTISDYVFKGEEK